jgi:hypothetical protein
VTQVALPLMDAGSPTLFDQAAPTSPSPRIPTAQRHSYEGHVYVLQFGSAVKVGTTTDPCSRIARHARSHLSNHGALSRIWISTPHVEAEANERALIDFCEARGRVIPGSSESFLGVDVDHVVTFAGSLPYHRVDVAEWRRRISAAREEQRRYTERTGFATSIQEFLDPDFVCVRRDIWDQVSALAGRSLPRMFGRVGDEYQIPEVQAGRVVDELIMSLAALRKSDAQAILDMDYIDLLQDAAMNMVRAEALNLRAFSIANGRQDMLTKVSAAWLAGVDEPGFGPGGDE